MYPRDGWLCWVDGKGCRPVVRAADIPATLGGEVTFNVGNTCAAAAAAICLGVDPERVGSALRDFTLSPAINRGRLNFHRLRDRLVVVDYAHNAPALRQVGEVLRRLCPRPILAVVACPGDRSEEAILEVGRTAAEAFDWVVFKEDADLRGRKRGEVAHLLERGARELAVREGAKRPPVGVRYQTILDEAEAVREALTRCPPGGTVVVFYEKYGVVMGALEEWERSQDMGVLGENA